MSRDDSRLSNRQRALLEEILELTWRSGRLVEIVDFRASHPEDRGELDGLLSLGMLARDGHGIEYRVDLLGLNALGTPRAKAIFERADALATELRRRFTDRELRRTPYPAAEVAHLWNVTDDECTLTLLHLKDMLYLWGAGLLGTIGNSDSALSVGGEGILDHPTIAAVVSQLRAWRSHYDPSPLADLPTIASELGELPAPEQPVISEARPGQPNDLLPTPKPRWLHAWPAIRACLQAFSFYEIKEIVGLAGFDLTELADLVQKSGGGATKGQLLTAIDAGVGKMNESARVRFLTITTEEILRRRPGTEGQLSDYLSRLGWSFAHSTLVPIGLLDPADLPETPEESHKDLVKAAQRLRDGDLTGAISAACGAVDSATVRIYELQGLGDPGLASFQERCKRAVEVTGVIPRLESQLRSLGWPDSEIVPFKRNFAGGLNHGAYVMQTLRSKMGDVHGSKPILKPLVFDCLKWAELMLSSLVSGADVATK